MRLTEKINNRYTCDYSLASEICNKLGQLEDIEDELGIGLIVLYKAIKNGIYVIEPIYEKDILFCGVEKIGWTANPRLFIRALPDEKLIIVGNQEYTFEFALKDYGKTWALTKEELE